MSTSISWAEIGLRLLLTVIAGTLVGLNRGEHGRPAGLRTNLLVCLAASLSMIQVNLLLATHGKANNSFISLDLMRLPLGILTGMGFIGGGAILKRGDLILGVTTAASLWFVTVLGLCFGGGQIGLGLIALAIGLFVLAGLKKLESHLPQDRRAQLILTASLEAGPSESTIQSLLRDAGFRILSSGIDFSRPQNQYTLQCEVRWHSEHPDRPLTLMNDLSNRAGVLHVSWHPQGIS